MHPPLVVKILYIERSGWLRQPIDRALGVQINRLSLFRQADETAHGSDMGSDANYLQAHAEYTLAFATASQRQKNRVDRP